MMSMANQLKDDNSGRQTLFSNEILPPWQLIPLPLNLPSKYIVERLDQCTRDLTVFSSKKSMFDELQYYSSNSTSSSLPLLRHYLSEFIELPPFDFQKILESERLEANTYYKWRTSLQGKITFEDLVGLNFLSTQGRSSLRKKPAYLVSRDRTKSIPMISSWDAHKRIEEIPDLFERGELGYGLLAASRILVLINNAHAFRDGNGRLGRFFFNFCLHRSGMPETTYLPLKTIALLSMGGYEIRLREAILFGCWDNIFEYYTNLVQFVLSFPNSSDNTANQVTMDRLKDV